MCLPSRALACKPPQAQPSAFRYACARHCRPRRPCSRLMRWSHISFLLAVVPGIGAYAGFAFLGAKFGSVSASLITYVLPISIVVLSILFLGEGPAVYHIVGGLLILAAVWLSVRR